MGLWTNQRGPVCARPGPLALAPPGGHPHWASGPAHLVSPLSVSLARAARRGLPYGQNARLILAAAVAAGKPRR